MTRPAPPGSCGECGLALRWEPVHAARDQRWLAVCACGMPWAFLPGRADHAPDDPLAAALGAGYRSAGGSPPWIRLFQLTSGYPWWLPWRHVGFVDADSTRQAEIVCRQPPRPLRERLSALIKEARERARRRRRRIAAAVIVLAAAAAILVVGGFFKTGYLSHHRNSVKGAAELGTVLVAKQLILKGASGSSIAAQNLFVVRTVPKVQMAPTAISDPGVLLGRVAAEDIYPNEQLATSSFTTPH